MYTLLFLLLFLFSCVLGVAAQSDCTCDAFEQDIYSVLQLQRFSPLPRRPTAVAALLANFCRPALIAIDAQERFRPTYSHQLANIDKAHRLFKGLGFPVWYKTWERPGVGSAAGRYYDWRKPEVPKASLFYSIRHENPLQFPLRELQTDTLYGRQHTEHMTTFTSFHTGMIESFKRDGVDAVFLMGGWTEHCVAATALHAWRLGYPTVLLHDAIGGSRRLRDPAFRFLSNLGFQLVDVGAIPVQAAAPGHLNYIENQQRIRKLPGWTGGSFRGLWDFDGMWYWNNHSDDRNSMRISKLLYKLPRKKSSVALIITDIGVPLPPASVEANKLLSFAEEMLLQGLPVYVTEPDSPITIRLQSLGAHIVEDLANDSAGAWHQMRSVSGVDTIALAGNLATKFLVATAYQAFDLDFDVALLADLCYWSDSQGALDEARKQNAFFVMTTAVAISMPSASISKPLPATKVAGYVYWVEVAMNMQRDGKRYIWTTEGQSKALSLPRCSLSFGDCVLHCKQSERCVAGIWSAKLCDCSMEGGSVTPGFGTLLVELDDLPIDAADGTFSLVQQPKMEDHVPTARPSPESERTVLHYFSAYLAKAPRRKFAI